MSDVAVAGVDFDQVSWERELEVQPLMLARAWQLYIHEHCIPKKQEVNRVVYVARNWLRIMGPDSPIGKWKRADTQRYVDVRLTEGVGPTTVRRESVLQQACRTHNKNWERIEKDCYFPKPGGEGKKRRPLTEEEFRRLMRSPLPRRIRMFYLLAYHTGHRARAIETLPWSRVNFEARTIDFNEPGARRTNKRRVDGFPIPDELLPRLEAAYAHPKRDEYVIGLSPTGLCTSTCHACKAALRAIGIDEHGICRHTIRKTYVTERIKAGANPTKIAALIADDPVTMHRHYSILNTEDLRETANMRAAA